MVRRRRRFTLALIGIGIFIMLPGILILGFGEWSTLSCWRQPSRQVDCEIRRRKAWGLIPYAMQPVVQVSGVTVEKPSRCLVDYCFFPLKILDPTQDWIVFKFYAYLPAEAAAVPISQFLKNPHELTFRGNYHEPFYMLALSTGVVLTGGVLVMVGVRA